MSLIGSIGSLQSSLLARMPGTQATMPTITPVRTPGIDLPAGTGATQPGGFGNVFEQLVDAVDTKQDLAAAATKDVLLGNTDQLHTSVIAMQEASTAFTLMVEVRNKLVESYQELMRMPV